MVSTTSPLRIAAFRRWNGIELDRPETLPPLREKVLLYCSFSEARGFYFFVDEAQRVAVLRRYLYTHWRDLSTIDSP